jgi:putative phosphoribosyl transferase
MARVTSEQSIEREVNVISGGLSLKGILGVPEQACGVVAFAHGSGSGRHSPRNQFVAQVLQKGGFATLLLDLLTEAEEQDRENVFDIALLADRLMGAANWLATETQTRSLPLGYFGASTGAAAALVAAARQTGLIRAVVSRGGRPDLAGKALPNVNAPTLLIVGGDDDPVIELNKIALRRLRCPKEMIIVPGATHLFEEPGTLEEVARLARGWFQRYLGPAEEVSEGR